MKTYSIENVGDLTGFPTAEAPAVLIDPGTEACWQTDAEQIVAALSPDYKIHVPASYEASGGVNYREIAGIIARDLLEKGAPQRPVQKIEAEIARALEVFYRVSGDPTPLASLRIVTEEYLKTEYPSVSQMYHRDSTALTITKCFFGDGAVYTDEDNIRREYFAERSISLSDDEALIDPSREYEVPDEMWVLLKGEMWKGIDSRSQSLLDFVLGKNAEFRDFAKGRGFIHKGGYFRRSKRRFVFTASTWKTDFNGGHA